MEYVAEAIIKTIKLLVNLCRGRPTADPELTERRGHAAAIIAIILAGLVVVAVIVGILSMRRS